MITLGRPKAELVLTNEERERLTALAARRKSAQALAQRARIVLGCAEGLSNTAVAEAERVTGQTVGKWRARSCSNAWPDWTMPPAAARRAH